MADPECFMRIRKTKKKFKSKAKKSQKILDSVVNTARYIKNIYINLGNWGETVGGAGGVRDDLKIAGTCRYLRFFFISFVLLK